MNKKHKNNKGQPATPPPLAPTKIEKSKQEIIDAGFAVKVFDDKKGTSEYVQIIDVLNGNKLVASGKSALEAYDRWVIAGKPKAELKVEPVEPKAEPKAELKVEPVEPKAEPKAEGQKGSEEKQKDTKTIDIFGRSPAAASVKQDDTGEKKNLAEKLKRGRGRPPGAKNRNKEDTSEVHPRKVTRKAEKAAAIYLDQLEELVVPLLTLAHQKLLTLAVQALKKRKDIRVSADHAENMARALMDLAKVYLEENAEKIGKYTIPLIVYLGGIGATIGLEVGVEEIEPQV